MGRIGELPAAPRPQQTISGVDLGVKTLAAATDGEKVLRIRGGGAKAAVPYRTTWLASRTTKQAGKLKGSRRWKAVQRRKEQLRDQSKRGIRAICHHATAPVAREFPGATCSVGEPGTAAAQRRGRRHAQPVSTACPRKLLSQLDDQTAGASTVHDAYRSPTCPVCGQPSKHRSI